MGNIRSAQLEETPVDVWWSNMSNPSEDVQVASASEDPLESPPKVLSSSEKLDEFTLELARKHEKRREILAAKRKELQDLREEVQMLRKENEQLKKNSLGEPCQKCNENELFQKELELKASEHQSLDDLSTKNKELRIYIAEMQRDLQNLNTEVLDFERERLEYKTHVIALKDVIAVSKQMLQIRDAQLKELKQKIEHIEETIAGKEMKILSEDLRAEYERQLDNIRHLRSLYEERQQQDRREKDELTRNLQRARKELEEQQQKQEELNERIKNLEEETSNKYDEIKNLESNLGLAKAESRQFQSELTVINQLFSEILLGFNSSQDINLDSLVRQLEDHHGLLQEIVVNEVSTEVSAALPKVLLDLINQVNCAKEKSEEENCVEEEVVGSNQMNSAEEIVENLPKVWRVLIELLSHQKAPQNCLTEANTSNENNPCYKTVQTPKGPSLVLSVSQTFIRLKDLILEKRSLEKETNHLKQLNTHLETRLSDQEKRLEMVSSELSKTWHAVDKLQKQHQLLHTQEKILRYELAQKRKLLTELKQELEYSREKWQEAREKNSSTEKQWRQLRAEFAARRAAITEDLHNSSVESGYSDERECLSSDEDVANGYETDVSECKALDEEPEKQEVSEEVIVKETETAVRTTQPKRTIEEIFAARDERLKRLEGECKDLVSQVTNTANRRVMITNKLDNLHETYGESSSGQNSNQETGASNEDNENKTVEETE